LKGFAMEHSFSYDKTSYPRAKFKSPFSAIGNFLEGDIQTSLVSCDSYLKACDDVLNNLIDEKSKTGNAFTVTIKKSEVILENNYDENEHCTISINDFQSIINSWKNFLINKPC